MDQITNALEPCKQFAKDSMRLVKRCTKPDRKGSSCFLLIISKRFNCSIVIVYLPYFVLSFSKRRRPPILFCSSKLKLTLIFSKNLEELEA